MSKFKVGDKVIYNGVHDEIDEIVYVGGKFFGYDLIINNIWPVKEKYLQPYKTPHERLVKLGWVALNASNGVLTYLLNADGSLHPERIELSLEGKRYYTSLRVIDLELAEILVDYLKELSNE